MTRLVRFDTLCDMSNETTKENHLRFWRQRAVRGISLFLAVVMAIAGFMKLVGLPMIADEFEHWLYPRWFMHFAGAFELVAAGLTAYPKTRRYGVCLVMAAMFGAIITHMKFDYEWTPLVLPILFFAAAWYVNWELRRETQGSGASSQLG